MLKWRIRVKENGFALFDWKGWGSFMHKEKWEGLRWDAIRRLSTSGYS